MKEDKELNQRFSYLFNRYIKGICSKEEANEVINFFENPENDQFIKSEVSNLWDQFPESIERFDSRDQILEKLHRRIDNLNEIKLKLAGFKKGFIKFIVRAAAVLFVPLLIYTGYLMYNVRDSHIAGLEQTVFQTVTVPSGVQIDFVLSDGSRVWLNSGTIFKYPSSFQSNLRQVEITGEGFFDIKEDPDHPFLVKAGNLSIEVKGTRFDVINYADEDQIEVILESGQVNLLNGDYLDHRLIGLLKPGEKATVNSSQNSISIQNVDIEKYTSWKNGILIFRDDPMIEVVKRISHKYNVDFELHGSDLRDYVYTATFTNESLSQILELLRLSAPIKYTIIDQKLLDNRSYSKSKIIITKIK